MAESSSIVFCCCVEDNYVPLKINTNPNLKHLVHEIGVGTSVSSEVFHTWFVVFDNDVMTVFLCKNVWVFSVMLLGYQLLISTIIQLWLIHIITRKQHIRGAVM